MPSDTLEQLRQEIAGLKQRLDAVIVAHNYQRPEVQEVADFVGDSLELAQRCAAVKARTIVVCGVRFMAETAAILNPDRTVLISVAGAGCPLADTITPALLRQWQERHPRATTVTYINSTAEIKAASYICCTSANAVAVVNSAPGDEVLFVPDQNLGRFVARQSRKNIVVYPGCCNVHDRLRAGDVKKAKAQHPEALVIVHPECREEVTALADAVLSTSQMLRRVKERPESSFIIGTEEGILYRMQRENPGKKFYPLAAGMICAEMKKTTLQTLAQTMRLQENVVAVPDDIRHKARVSIERMLAVKTGG